MPWKEMSFEREKLFDEVWTTPVTKLAKDYGVSDVGLRKICVALDVPLPPRGYWAKLAAGKPTPKPALGKTTVATTYVRMINVVEVDKVLDERVAKAQDATESVPRLDRPDYAPPSDPSAFCPQAKLVVRAMKNTKSDEGALSSIGVTWADISVSEELKDRALLLVDRFANELLLMGAKFENSYPPLPPHRRGARRERNSKRNCFILHEQHLFIRIQERITQELVPPPAPKPLKTMRGGLRQPAWEYRPPQYRYIPTGKLYASVVDASSYYESYKLDDSVRGTIETKVRKAVLSVTDSALRRNVAAVVRAEREVDRRKKAQEWEASKANKDALLKALAGFETMAKDLDRARSLRRLVDEIKASPAAPAELVGSLELMSLMADWLDPLVKAPWPEVDDIAERNPHGSLW